MPTARVDDRRVLNGISGSSGLTLYGPRTTCYNRFLPGGGAGVIFGMWMTLFCGDGAMVLCTRFLLTCTCSSSRFYGSVRGIAFERTMGWNSCDLYCLKLG
jgi:hypothetical protein